MGDTVWKPLSLHGRNGKRKYLNLTERELFMEASLKLPTARRAFCLILAYTGCRISEALALNSENLDAIEGMLIFETLKQRRKGVFRAVPIPRALIQLCIRPASDLLAKIGRGGYGAGHGNTNSDSSQWREAPPVH